MAQRINIFLSGGSGQVSLSPEPDANGLYNPLEEITITLTLDSGYTFVNWTVDGVEVGTSTTLIYTLGRSDKLLVATATGSATDAFTYGLRFWDEYVDDQNRKSRITIEEKDYVGDSERVTIKNPTYQIGEFDGEPVKTFVTSRLEFTFQIEKNVPDLSDILTLDPRRFRVKWYRNYISTITYDFIWIGYLKTDFLSRPEYRDTYDVDVIATDGLSDLEGYLLQVPSLNFQSVARLIANLLNRTFKDGLKIRECVRVFETRMDALDIDSVWWQFLVNQDAFYQDEARFQEEGSFIIFNPGKNVKDAIETIVKQFVVRVFQWNGFWYIVRVAEYSKHILKFTELGVTGGLSDYFSVNNDQEFECLGNVVRNGKVSYTRFNAILKLGSIDRPENRAIISDTLGSSSWGRGGRGTTLPVNLLARWDYINAVGTTGSQLATTAYIERVSNPSNGEAGDYVRIWGTADGLADPDLSGIKFRNIAFRSGAVKGADLITIQAKFQVARGFGSVPRMPRRGSHVVGLQVKIGASFLQYDGDVTFTWSTSPTVPFIYFPVENSEVFNLIDIPNLVVPEDGDIEFTLYQLITLTGTLHRYIVDWRDINVNLSRNDALTYKEILAKAVTNEPFEKQYPDYVTFIGDALTPVSSSAILMGEVVDMPVSETWYREGEVETEPLLGIVLQDLVNIYGKNNYSFTAAIKESDAGAGIDFSNGLTYKGKKQIFTAARLDDRSGIWTFEFYQMEPEVEIST